MSESRLGAILDLVRQGSPRQLSHGRTDRWDGAGICLDPPDPQAHAPLDLVAAFGNRRPVEMEIGCGKGTFLLARAAARPELNLLGFEYAKAYGMYTADRCRRAGLTNVRIVCTDAGPLLRRYLPAASILRAHVYFPDPWPKTKHHRRRLLQPATLAAIWRILVPGGQLLVVTDHLGYFRHISESLTQVPGFISISFPAMADTTGEIVGTNFERKYITEGRPFFRLAALKYLSSVRVRGGPADSQAKGSLSGSY